MAPPANKFGFAIVSPESNSVETYAVAAALSPTNIVGDLPPVYSSASDAEDTDDFASLRSPTTTKYTVDQSRNSPEFVASEFASPPSPIPARLPRLSRAISLPIPSELGYLRHPTKPKLRGPTLTGQDEVSLELADSVQAVVQTILHLSPPHLLDPVKEQFSACTIQLPTPSVSSLLTTMKNLNYMSANLSSFTSEPSDDDPGEQTLGHFDIGEVIQSVADVLSGTAAEANVDLVLFHADVGMKHVNVVGDECCISFVLAHILRQIINSARPNDAVEVGLHIKSANATEDPLSDMTNTGSLGDNISPIILEEGAPLTCTLNINHRSKSEYENENEGDHTPDEPIEVDDDEWEHRAPKLDSIFLRRLLHRMKAVLTVNPCPTTSLICDVAYSITFNLTQGVSPLSPSSNPLYFLRPEEEAARQPFQPSFKLAKEPTLEELAIFTETSLKGKRAVFHASETSTFAHHLTSYLTNWGLDLQHVPMGAPFDDESGQSLGDRRNAESGYGNTAQTGLEPFTTPGSSASQQSQDSQATLDASGAGKVNPEPSFIIIDDDVNVLRRRLGKYRPETPYPLHLHPRKRPSLATNHRPRSTPHVRQFLINTTPVTFIHFTSLANYKLVRDAVQSAFFLLPASQIPEVIVIPKPAGPRRFLTALHTAVRRPYVDPSFFPIATSPQSPGAMSPVSQPASFMGHTGNGGGGGGGNPSSGASMRSNGSGTSPTASTSRNSVNNSQSAHSPSEWVGPTRSPRDRGYSNSSNGIPDFLPHVPTPSPLAADSLEYFSETAAKIGGGTAASGLVIQSPDGRPAGIFFQPQRSASRNSSRSDSAPPTPALVSNGSRGHLEREARLANNNGNPGSSPMSRRPSTESRNPSKLSRTLSTASRPSSSEGPAGDLTSPPAFGSNDVSAIRRQRGITLAGPTRRPEHLDDDSPTPTSASFPRGSRSRPTSAHGTADSPSSPATSPNEPGARPSITPSNSGSRKTIGRTRAGSASTIERRKTSTGTQGPDQGSPLSPVQLQNIASPGPSSQTTKNDEKKPTRPVVRTSSRRSAVGDTPLGPRKPSQLGSPLSASNNQLPHTGKGIPRKTSSDVKSITKGKMGGITPPISVLIVEDNPINQAIMTTWMRRRKFKYGTAKDGAEAVEKWRTGGFHLILMDIQMPVMDGIEATKEIRRLEKLSYASAFPSATPPGDQSRANSALSDLARTAPPTPFHSSVIIVALTASSLESDRVNALAAGCNDFLTKPVSLPWLDKKIIEWGSIKALQMWANPDLTKDIQTGQDAKVKAFQLHIPRTEARASPTPTPTSAVPTTGSDGIPPVIVPVSTSSNEPKAATDVPLPVPEASHSKGDNQTPFIGGEEALTIYLSEQDNEESRDALHRKESLIKHGRKGVSPTAPSIASVLSTPISTHDALPPATDAVPLPSPNICNIKQPGTPIITPPSPPGEKHSN